KVEVGPALTAKLDQEIAAAGPARIVVHAGHYVLDGSSLALTEEIEEMAAMGDFAAFTRYSWRLGCELVAAALGRGQTAQLMVLVNDWQFVRDTAGTRRDSERFAAQLRQQYYERRSSLPEHHLQVLTELGLKAADILKATEDRWLFSESDLRTALGRSVAALFAAGKAEERGLTRHFQPSGDPVITVCSSMGAEMNLLFCGSTNCAGEVIELLRELSERDLGLFINLYPRPCLAPVSTGTILAGQLYGLHGLRVVNVALPLGIDGDPLHSIVDPITY
ncbi:MAG TPA: hypothetical protein VMM92_11395, partial [Thermoanaerobaculia bacterium]|nr:hypothetical protein [Thermoanaerobaculia bacterium]